MEEYTYPFEQIGWDFGEFITPRLYSFAGWMKRCFLPFYKNVEHDKIVIFKS